MKINKFWFGVKIILIYILVVMFLKAVVIFGFPRDSSLGGIISIYMFILALLLYLLVDLLSTITQRVEKIIKKFHKKKPYPTIIIPKKKRKKKHKKIEQVSSPIEKVATTGEILRSLGVKRERVKKPKENRIICLKTKKPKKIPRRDLSGFIEQLNNKGYIEISDNLHLGKVRGYDVLILLRKELKKQGIKTKKVRKKLILCE